MKCVLFCQNNYAFGILEPIKTYLTDNGHEYIWYVNPKIIQDYPYTNEPHTSSIGALMSYQSDAIFVPGNEVPHYLRGVKVQVFHGFFSVEGWELGTVTGIVICVIVSYLRDTIHFSSWLMTILITQVFQVLWFIVQSVLLYVHLGSLNYILERAVTFFPQSVVIALLSPFFFFILNRFWNDDPKGSLGAGI